MKRRSFLTGFGAAVTLAPGITLRAARDESAVNPALVKANPKFLPTAQMVHQWHAEKDSKGGPTLAGSPSWHNYMALLERELKAAGVVDIFHNQIPYTRWYTTEWPDETNWSLQVDGQKVKVASYGANSGHTPDAGVKGPLVLYEKGMPGEALQGKIAVLVRTPADDTSTNGPRLNDYEYLANAETFPNPLEPRLQEGELVTPFPLMGLAAAGPELEKAGAAGALIVMPISYEALAGTYEFPVPKLHEMPTLYIDKGTGVGLVEAARAGKTATLKLLAKTEPVEAYQFFGYLPGRNYGTPEDEQVILTTHTDGPSISQENGGLGILSMVRYFSRIPKAERPRTLMLFYDCRHYMPGAERAFAAQDYAASHPDVYKKAIAAMGIEHLGQIEVVEKPGVPYHKTKKVELSSVWVTQNQHLVDMAIRAVKENHLERVQVQCPGRPGVHGGGQGPWYGLGNLANRLKITGISTMGSMGAYWSSKARMDYLDVNQFLTQMAMMSQLCGELMTAEVAAVASVKKA